MLYFLTGNDNGRVAHHSIVLGIFDNALAIFQDAKNTVAFFLRGLLVGEFEHFLELFNLLLCFGMMLFDALF